MSTRIIVEQVQQQSIWTPTSDQEMTNAIDPRLVAKVWKGRCSGFLFEGVEGIITDIDSYFEGSGLCSIEQLQSDFGREFIEGAEVEAEKYQAICSIGTARVSSFYLLRQPEVSECNVVPVSTGNDAGFMDLTLERGTAIALVIIGNRVVCTKDGIPVDDAIDVVDNIVDQTNQYE